MGSLFERVCATIAEQHLISDGESLLVGVSGGPDSAALLDILVRRAPAHDNRLIVCHFNHRLRPIESDQDQQFVVQLADTHGLAREIRSADVRRYAHEQKLSLEDAARLLRYEFFRDVAHEWGVHKLALAHNADDQIETMLLRLLRGAGLRGLAAMQSERKMKSLVIIRPLLDVWKTEILEYLRQRNLSWRTDLSNLDPAFTRNRLRLELIPLLEAEYNPNIKKILLHTADIVGDDDRLLDEQARAAYEQCREGEALRVSRLILQDIALQRRIIRHWLAELTVPLVPGFEQVEAICELTGRAQGGFGSVDLPGRRIVYRDYDLLRIGDPLVHELLEVFRPLRVPGSTPVPELGIQVDAELIENTAAPDLPLGQQKEVECFDLEALGTDLAVRNWREGDRYQPLGLHGTKKLHDIFVDEKIPACQRHKVPLLVTGDGRIAWVIGYRIAEPFKITPRTRRILRVRVTPLATEGGPGAPVEEPDGARPPAPSS